jgi:DNA-binding LacI/PurR family transcriptional regulator
MADIARRAGVALSTVSYVLSGKRSVSEETRARVHEAIRELDYHPHPRARALASGTSRTIALFLPSANWSQLPVQQTFVAGVTQATSEHDYALLLSTAATDPSHVAELVEKRRADGVILMEILLEDPRVEILKDRELPFSLIGHCEDNTNISYVDLDFADAINRAVRHLAELGHRHIALFNFPAEQLAAGYCSAVRGHHAFEEATTAAGIEGIHIPCPHTIPEAYAATEDLLHQHPSCTAAITTGWQFSGLLAAARDAHLSIPEDFSLVAIISPQFAEMLTPTLSGIDWPAFEAGKTAAELLITRLAGGEEDPTQILLHNELVTRQSTGPAPTAARRARSNSRDGHTAAARTSAAN